MSNRRTFIQQLAWGGAAFMAAQFPHSLYAGDDFLTLSILHTNDLHCHFEPFPMSDSRYAGKGGLTRLSGLVQQVRSKNPNVFLFDAGDMFQGTPYFNYFKGELILKVMSQMMYDAGTLGNHEFDNGLSGIQSALPFALFPLLSSNYDFSNTILNNAFLPYRIFEKEGVRLGVYALGIEMQGLVSKVNYGDTRYIDSVKTARKMELFLKKEAECDLVICLSHLGIQYKGNKVSDHVIAHETRYTDLIIGGHTHTFLEDAIRVKNKAGNPVVINQSGYGALMLGQVDFVIERGSRNKKVFTSSRTNG